MQLNSTPATRQLQSQGAELLAALFRDAPDNQFLHFRIIAPGGPVREQIYHLLADAGTDKKEESEVNKRVTKKGRTQREDTRNLNVTRK